MEWQDRFQGQGLAAIALLKWWGKDISAIIVAHGVIPNDRDRPIVFRDERLCDMVLSVKQILNARASQSRPPFFFKKNDK